MPSVTLRPLLALAASAATLAVAGCGDDHDSAASTPASSSADTPVVVSAAASLKEAFTTYGDAFTGGEPKFSFAGSDDLAAQIKAGAKPDVFAAANTKLPDELHAAGLVERPVVFAGNRLVLAVAADSKIDDLDDLTGDDLDLAIGSASVPIGSYTHEVLGRLRATEEQAILANVRSEEPDVKGIVGKLTQGAVDAGFVYVTDVKAADGRLKAIELPPELEPSASYGVAVVKDGRNPTGARAFVDGLLTGAGAGALQAAGFEAPHAGE